MTGRLKQRFLDQAAAFLGLYRASGEDYTLVPRMNSPYHASVRTPINLAFPWHRSASEVSEGNHKIVTGKLS